MIDRLTRRALTISLGVHAALLLATFVAFGPSDPTRPPEPPRPMPAPARPAPTAKPMAPAPAPTVRAEDRIQPAAGPLPALGPGGHPPTVVSHRPTDRMAGTTTTRGRDGEGDAPAVLPAATPGQAPTLAALQGRTRNVRLDDELVRLQTARTMIELAARAEYRRTWSTHSTRITRRDLIVWVQLDARGYVLRGGLFHCSTGVAEVDAAIGRWLNAAGEDRIRLPSLPTGVTHHLELRLP